MMYDGLIILAKTSQLSCVWFAAGKEVCKEGWFPQVKLLKEHILELDRVLPNLVFHHQT